MWNGVLLLSARSFQKFHKAPGLSCRFEQDFGRSERLNTDVNFSFLGLAGDQVCACFSDNAHI